MARAPHPRHAWPPITSTGLHSYERSNRALARAATGAGTPWFTRHGVGARSSERFAFFFGDIAALKKSNGAAIDGSVREALFTIA